MQHKFTDIQFMYVEHSKHELHLLDLRQGGSKQQQQDGEDNAVDRKLCLYQHRVCLSSSGYRPALFGVQTVSL